ncbi:MAG TPA: peptide deformylase [Sedimentisphaerales bacterium]|nr:peptide deformylase [Sedimentisphaerales bacterium]
MVDIDIEKCKITFYPAEVLGRPAEPVANIDHRVCELVQKMADIMFQNKGLGLAAPQAGVSLRLFIICLDGTRENLKVYINPVVTTAGELEEKEEGCLSVPGVYTKIRRYSKATVTAADIRGNEFTEQADGLYARCLQHERDHIDGVTITDHMSSVAKIMHRKRLNKLKENYRKTTQK